MEVINSVMGRVATDFAAVAATPAAVAATAEAACTAPAYAGVFADWPPAWLRDWSWQPLLPWNWSFQIDWTLLIDAFGLTLAIIGLFNLGPKLQAWSETVVEYADYCERVTAHELRAIWPLHKSWWFLMKEGLKTSIEWCWVIPFAFLASGEWGSLINFVARLQVWQWAILIAAYPLLATIARLVIEIMSALTVIVFAGIVWRVSNVLNYPPAGVLGGIGFLIAALSIFMNRVH